MIRPTLVFVTATPFWVALMVAMAVSLITGADAHGLAFDDRRVSPTFAISPGSVYDGSEIVFVSQNTREWIDGAFRDTWVWWNLGDGTTSRERRVTHRYDGPGTYDVTYTVCAGVGICASETRTVTVEPTSSMPDVEIAYAPAPPSVGESVQFISRTMSPLVTHEEFADWSYTWDFGDGSTVWGRYPRHVYTDPGSYDVTLTVCRSRRCNPPEVVTVEVAAAPVNHPGTIVVDVAPSVIRVGSTAELTVSSPDVDIVGSFFMLDRIGLSTAPGNPSSVEATFTQPFDRLVVAACYVEGELHCELIDRALRIEPPAAGGTATDPAAPGDIAAFTISDGVRLEWTDTNDLEDGYEVRSGKDADSLSTVRIYPRHTRAVRVDEDTRCFEVRAVFGTARGPVASACVVPDNEATPLPASTTPAWFAHPAELRAGEEVTFLQRVFPADRLFFGGPDGLSWDFGDGSSSSALTARTHVYDEPGTYEVTLLGCDDCPATRSITVLEAADEDMNEAAGNGGGELAAPADLKYVVGLSGPSALRWTDTNDGEDRYEIYQATSDIAEGDYMGLHAALPADATRTSLSGSNDRCYEVRAVRGDEVGPAAAVCNVVYGYQLFDLAAEFDADTGETTVSIIAVVDNADGLWVVFDDVGNESESCAFNAEFLNADQYDYELAAPRGVVRSYVISTAEYESAQEVFVNRSGINFNESPCGTYRDSAPIIPVR